MRQIIVLLLMATVSLSNSSLARAEPEPARRATSLVVPPASAVDVERTSDSVREQLDEVLRLSRETSAALSRYRGWALWGLGIGGPLFALLGFFGYAQLRDWFRGYVERRLSGAMSIAVKDALPGVLADTQARAEQYLLRLAKLLALRSNSAFDEALAEFGWDGRVSSLRGETTLTRRAVIECLYGAKKNRGSLRDAAWEAITELLQDDTSAETARLYLKLCISLRRFPDGLAFIERARELVIADQESALRAATILRRSGRLTEALQLAEKFAGHDDPGVAVTVAVLQRDLGKFDEVHDVLLPQVNKLISSPSVDLPDGWHRVLNTFIANCLDRAHPEDAIGSAEFVMRSAPGPVETFTVGRLILALSHTDDKRNELLPRFRDAVVRQMPGEATTRCHVILAQLEGRIGDAIELLRKSIVEHTGPHGEPMKPDVYFQRCNLAGLLIDKGDTAEAIDLLMPAVGASHGGEAKYLLALAYGKQGEGRDAARWVRQAVDESPKWAEHARDNDVLKRMHEVADELARPTRA